MLVSFPAAFFRIAHHPPQDLTLKAPKRLRWLNCWQALRQQGLSARKASNVLSLPRSTLYRWQRQLKGYRLKGLEDKSHRPKRLRQPMWNPKMVDEILRLREEYPRWGKDKLVILIKRKEMFAWISDYLSSAFAQGSVPVLLFSVRFCGGEKHEVLPLGILCRRL